MFTYPGMKTGIKNECYHWVVDISRCYSDIQIFLIGTKVGIDGVEQRLEEGRPFSPNSP